MPIKRLLGLSALVVAVFLQLMLMTRPAAAQACSTSVTMLAFGSVDVTANVAVDSSATITVSCTALAPVGVCINIGPGNGGATNAANRFLANGGNLLRYGLFSDPGRNVPWGSDAWPVGGAQSIGFNIPILLGTGSVSKTIYARVYGAQPTTAPLSYTSVFSGADISIRYGLLSFLLGCDLLTKTDTASFTATANVPPTCRITTSNLNFGSTGILAVSRDASSILTPTCTNGTAFRIGLDGGLSGASDPTQRRMMKGSEAVIYGLFRDAARAQPFGNSAGADTTSLTGTGLAQNTSVFGRVRPQPTPSPGSYTDTVVATITY